MTEIGKFRTINLEDLAKYRYLGMDSRMRREIDNLASQGLVQTKSVWTGKDHETLKVVTLTKAGKKYLDRAGVEGVLYVGIVKPNEIAHDSAIYRMYQKELERIAKDGGTIQKVTLDYELKKQVYSKLAKEKPGAPEYKQRQQEIAAEHGLKVVRGHIQLPDLRIEYKTREGLVEQRDLELATTHYRCGSLGAKAEAASSFTLLRKMRAASAPSSSYTRPAMTAAGTKRKTMSFAR
jgi:hypothetical protein